MTPRSFILTRSARWFAAAVLAVSSGLASAACSAPRDAGACPLQSGPLVFDRCFTSLEGKPTAVGNQACDALRNSSKLLDQLGVNADKARRDAERDWNDLVKVATRDAIDTEAVLDLQRALNVGKEIERDVNGFMQDRDCGSAAAMATLNRKFTEAASFLVQAGQVGQLSLQAAGQLRPVLDELGKISAELQRLATAANAKGGKAKTEFDTLQKAVNDLTKEVQTLLATDFGSVVTSGTALVGSVGPFITECAGCATSLAAAVGSLSAGSGATAGGGAACPESAGAGCILAAVGLPLGTTGAAISSAVGSPACVAATAGLASMQQKYQDIANFVNGMVKLANAIPKSVTQAVTAGQALTRLAAEMGNEGKQSITAIQASLNRMQPAFDVAGDTLEQQIAPRVSRMAGDFVSTLGQDTARLGKCYDKLTVVMANLGGDVYDAMTLLAEASTQAVDAGKVVSNLQSQGQDAVRSATSFAVKEWGDLKDEQKRMNRRTWGVDPGVVDLGKTVPHLIALAGNPNEVADIVGDSAKLLQREAQIVVNSLNAGKRAFLDQDRLTTQAKGKYGTAKAKAKQATIEFAKAKAKAEAKLATAKKVGPVAQPQALAAWPSAPRQRMAQLAIR